MVYDFMHGWGRFDDQEYGEPLELYSDYDLQVGIDYAEDYLEEGVTHEPFHKYDFRAFIAWAEERLKGGHMPEIDLSKLFWQVENCWSRPGARKRTCHFCDEAFLPTDVPNEFRAGDTTDDHRITKSGMALQEEWKRFPVVVAERRVSNLRGEDEVYFAHKECCSKNKILFHERPR